ncbi:angiopoietin-2-like [Eriocheir sinensis]|uniref:angiopoietin-2-like n=1 Tax=Eriocheir sinensis TaxID=95602 RepID=UPI0021C6BA23|nr:angiopoietin-2-like [Eriocheir sinensis]
MASVQWPLLVVILLTGVSTALLFTNKKSEEDPGYSVRRHVVRGYESDGTLTGRGSNRYNAPPKESDKDDKKTDGDSEGKDAEEKDGGATEEDKNAAEGDEVTDKEDEKDKKSAKDKENTNEDKNAKEDKDAKEDKNAKEDKDAKEDKGAEEDIKAEDDIGAKEDKNAEEDKDAEEDKSSAEDKKTAKEDKGSAETDKDISSIKKSPPKSAKKKFVISDNKKCPTNKTGDSRGGRNLFDDSFDVSADSTEGKLRVLEVVISIICNHTEESEPQIQGNCVDKKTFKETFASFQYLALFVQQAQAEYTSLFMKMFALDCSDLGNMINESSLQTFSLQYKGKRPVTVMCDMETDGGGWTIVQRRNSNVKNIDFNRGWYEYKVGFGDPAGEYWVGLENLYAWTNMRQYQLRIELMDYDGNCKYAVYKHFYLDDETQGYRLHVTGYVGNAGDALTRKNIRDNFTADGMMFSTKDRDNDMSKDINCAQLWKSGGWWYNRCAWANLNGPSWIQADGTGIGINWHAWRNKEHLKSAIMMIRPVEEY